VRLRQLAAALGAVLVAAGAAALFTAPDGSGRRPPGPPPKVFVFVSSVGGRELVRLRQLGRRIDVVAPNWYALDAGSGRLRAPSPGSVRRLLAVTRRARIRVWPTVNALTRGSRAWEAPAARERIAASLSMAAREAGASGVTLDMEELRPGQRTAFTALVVEAAARLHRAHKRLAVYVPRPGPGEGAAYDWAAIADGADLLLTSGYNEHWSGGGPGPITTSAGFGHVLRLGLELAGPRKAVPLLGAFGYRWPHPRRGQLVSTIEAERLRRRPGAAAVRSDGAERFASGGDMVVYETVTGLRARARAARAAGAQWIGLFSLGREPLRFWDGMRTARDRRRHAG
jgi:spore germination protein YaaH